MALWNVKYKAPWGVELQPKHVSNLAATKWNSLNQITLSLWLLGNVAKIALVLSLALRPHTSVIIVDLFWEILGE